MGEILFDRCTQAHTNANRLVIDYFSDIITEPVARKLGISTVGIEITELIKLFFNLTPDEIRRIALSLSDKIISKETDGRERTLVDESCIETARKSIFDD